MTSLFQERCQIQVRKDAKIASAPDLKGMRVGVGVASMQGFLIDVDKWCERIGLPWSPELVQRARRSAGATIEACRAALEDGVAVNLGGGTHHAFPDHGQGYCILNDAAIALRAMQAEVRVRRIFIFRTVEAAVLHAESCKGKTGAQPKP